MVVKINTWMWPFCLYHHIRKLEAEVVKLMNENGDLKQRNEELARQLADDQLRSLNSGH